MDITTTEVERYGVTYYDIRRDGKQFCLSNFGVTAAKDRDLTEAIAQALPEGFTVQFRPAKANSLLAQASWTVYDGDRTVAKVHSIDDIVPAALRVLSEPVRVAEKILADAAPVASPPRPDFRPELVRTIFHGDDHYTYHYADGTSYDTESGWTR